MKSSHFSGNIFYKIKSFINLILGFLQIFFILIKIRPSNCISFGSYATFAPMLSSMILKKFINASVYIHEQNSIIGKVNLIYLPFIKNIFSNFNTLNNLKLKFSDKMISVGLPSRSSVNLKIFKKKIDHNNITIFIYGGSQGSLKIIELFLSILSNLENNIIKNINLVIQSPKELHLSINKSMSVFKIKYKLQEFFFNIEEILSITDVAISRGGAGTINDLIKYRIPSIIFPISNSVYNHQYLNAKILLDINAAIVLDENNFDSIKGAEVFSDLINNKNKYTLMKKSLEKIKVLDANRIMLDTIYE